MEDFSPRGLRRKLDELALDRRELSRDDLIAILTALIDYLSPWLMVDTGHVFEGDPICEQHPAITKISVLIDALDDLRYGKSHPAITPAPRGANALHTRSELRRIAALLEIVDIYVTSNLMTYPAARKLLEKQLRRGGATFRSGPITKQRLRTWHDRRVRNPDWLRKLGGS